MSTKNCHECLCFKGKVHCKDQESHSRKGRSFSEVQTRGHQAMDKVLCAYQKHNTFLDGFFNSKNSSEKNQDKVEVQCNTTHFLYKLLIPTKLD